MKIFNHDYSFVRMGGLLFCVTFLLFTHHINAQERKSISGTIVSISDNTPLPGVNVFVKGSSNGTVTDFDGRYELKAKNTDTLVITYVGFNTEEILIDNKKVIHVSLVETLNQLDELVIVGYGSVKKSDVTGAVTSIKSEDIVQARSASFMEALQGRMSGVQVKQQSGEPGAAIDIKIRGANSVNASSNPLYVIDGVQIDIDQSEVANSSVGNSSSLNPLATLDPNDIESIEVLKDASATAIYGSRGANGVVIVTTKGGGNRKALFSYNTYLSFAEASKKLDVLSPENYLVYRKQEDTNNDDSLFWKDTDGDGIKETPRDISELTLRDWQDEALRTAMTQSHHISASGGNSKTQFSTSLGYLDQEGIVINNEYKRINFRGNITQTFSDKFKAGFMYSTAYSSQSGATSSGGPEQFNGVLQSIVLSKPVEFYDPDDPDDQEFGQYISPITQIVNSEKNTSLSQNLANVFLQYNFSKKLSAKLSGGGRFSNSKGKEFYGRNTRSGVKENARGVLQHRSAQSFNVTAQVNYNFKLHKIHNFRLMLASEYGYNNNERFKLDATNFPDESTGINDISKAQSFKEYSSNRYESNRLSYFGRINYSLRGKYLFTGSLRRDGSDKFGPGNKWGTFPSAAIAWKINKEKFLKESNTLSNLKLRLGYGVTGNERIPAYSYFSRMGNTYIGSNGSSQLGLAPFTRGNPNLKWEKTTQYNLGIDVGLLKGRISITADAYHKKTDDMLLLTPIPAQSGYFQEFSNIGNVKNEGVEFAVTSHNITNDQFSWETNFNIATNKNTVLSLGSASNIPVVINGGFITNVGVVQVGESIGAIYGYEWDGVYQISDFTWQNNSDPTIPFESRNFVLKPGVVSVAGASVAPGSLKFKDISGPNGEPDGIVNSEQDRKVIGNSYPDIFGGMNNSFKLGNFDMQFFLEFQYGNEIFNESRFRMEGRQSFNISQGFFENRWTPDNPSNEYGTITAKNATSQLASSYYVEDGSYIRLANVTVGYNLPEKTLNKVGMHALRFYVTGNNLMTWTKYSNYDPDVSFNNPLLTGFDRISYPRSRTFVLGINMTF